MTAIKKIVSQNISETEFLQSFEWLCILNKKGFGLKIFMMIDRDKNNI
jgi:hypothetical protein